MKDPMEDGPWLRAILAADTVHSRYYENREGRKPSDTGPLIELLRSNTPLPKDKALRDFRDVLADLLARHKPLAKLKDGQRDPRHTLSEAEALLEIAGKRFDKLRKEQVDKGLKPNLDELIAVVLDTPDPDAPFTKGNILLRDCGLKVKTLKNFLQGKRGSTRRRLER